MKNSRWKSVSALPAALLLAVPMWVGTAAAESPKKGGILKFVVPDEPSWGRLGLFDTPHRG